MPLTAASLLTLKESPNPPPLTNFTDEDLNAYGKLRWRRVQQLAEAFWAKWRRDYMSQLINREKWTKDHPNMCVNDVVVLRGKTTPRNDWPVGVVEKVFPSDDEVVRSCEVRTNKGTYIRPVCELIKLIPGGPGVSCQADKLDKK